MASRGRGRRGRPRGTGQAPPTFDQPPVFDQQAFAEAVGIAAAAADEYLKYSFYPYALFSFSSVFMLNKCPNALKVHTYDQVIHLVELYKIGGKTAIEAAREATEF